MRGVGDELALGLERRLQAPEQVIERATGRLRAKLGEPPMIHTVREAGYRIGAE
jgi:DNA-binding response OmpR family regulator